MEPRITSARMPPFHVKHLTVGRPTAGVAGSWDDQSISAGQSVANSDERRTDRPSEELPSPSVDDAAVSDSDSAAEEASAHETITTMAALDDLDPEERRRAALVDSLPAASDDTPLMAELKQDARRRIELRGRRVPAPPADAGDHGRQPEGWRRQDDDHREPGGGAGAVGTERPGARQRPAGQRVDGARRRAPRGHAVDLRGSGRRCARSRRRCRRARTSRTCWCLPATIDLSGAEIELVSMVARETRLRNALDTLPRVADARTARSASTTSSSTARRASGCSPSTRSWSLARCSSRSSASTTRWRA